MCAAGRDGLQPHRDTSKLGNVEERLRVLVHTRCGWRQSRHDVIVVHKPEVPQPVDVGVHLLQERGKADVPDSRLSEVSRAGLRSCAIERSVDVRKDVRCEEGCHGTS